jgi:hypothetical protein
LCYVALYVPSFVIVEICTCHNVPRETYHSALFVSILFCMIFGAGRGTRRTGNMKLFLPSVEINCTTVGNCSCVTTLGKLPSVKQIRVRVCWNSVRRFTVAREQGAGESIGRIMQ